MLQPLLGGWNKNALLDLHALGLPVIWRGIPNLPGRREAQLGYQCCLEYHSGELDPDLRSEVLNHGGMLCCAQESPDMYSVLVYICLVVEIESL